MQGRIMISVQIRFQILLVAVLAVSSSVAFLSSSRTNSLLHRLPWVATTTTTIASCHPRARDSCRALFATNTDRVNDSSSVNTRRQLQSNQHQQQEVLKLSNPLKIQRVAAEPAPRPSSSPNGGGGGDYNGDNRRGGGGGGGGNKNNYNNNNNNNRQDRSQDRRPRPAGTSTNGDGRSGTATRDRGGAGGGRSPVARAFDGGGVAVGPLPDKGRGGGAGVKNRPKTRRDDDDRPKRRAVPDTRGTDDDGRSSRNVGRASLRVKSSGRGGRSTDSNQRRGTLKKRDRSATREAKFEAALERKTVNLHDGPLSVNELAEILGEKPVSVIKYLMSDLGIMASLTQSLDPITCRAVAEGFGKIVGGDDEDDELFELLADESALATGFVGDDEDPSSLLPRPPVVTIMGHVDHGKTSLLDAIRNTHVTAGEFGGITQHITAYQVNHKGNIITFIDTPGHAAFTDMRERGANITDIVILVVAADDGVKQQTADSIACARQSGVPMIVAINKCDLDAADPVRVMTELTTYDILTEDLGGDVLCSQISAKQGSNLDDLLDKIMLQTEIQDLKANPDRCAEAVVVEANVEKGLGTVATTLVQKGTLRIGDIFVAGETYGKVRALISTSDSTRLTEAGPSVPVRVVGFEGTPAAGDALIVAKDEQTARELAESRQRIARERQSSSYQDGLFSSVAKSFGSGKERKEMCVVVKADVQGTAEALTRALRELKLENDERIVTIKVLVSEAGEVSKSDIAIASVSPGTTVIAFNVAASFAATEEARSLGIPIEYYNIVYDAIESVESRMQEVLSPTPDGEYAGSAIVQQVFDIGGTGNIAGCRCRDGYVRKGTNIRVMRGDKILTETKVRTLRSFKSEVDSVDEGSECGIGLVDFEDFQEGDVIECYVEK